MTEKFCDYQQLLPYLRAQGRTGQYLIAVPLVFPQPVESPNGPAMASVSILGFYQDIKVAQEVIDQLILKFPRQIFLLRPTNDFINICAQYQNIDLVPTEGNQITAATRALVEEQRRIREAMTRKEEIVDDFQQKEKNHDSVEHYAQLRYQQWSLKMRLAEMQNELIYLSSKYNEQEVRQCLERRLGATDELHLVDKIMS